MKQLLLVLFGMLCFTVPLSPAAWYDSIEQLPTGVQVNLRTAHNTIIDKTSESVYNAGSTMQLSCFITNKNKWHVIEVIYLLNSVLLGNFSYADESQQEVIWHNSDQLDHNIGLNVYPMSGVDGFSMWSFIGIHPLSSEAGSGVYRCVIWLGKSGNKKEAKFVSNLLPIVFK